jgi:hypothetical protein
MAYTDKSVVYLVQLRESGLDWQEVTEIWNEEFGSVQGEKTLNALRKKYKAVQDVEDFSDDFALKNLQTTHTARKRASKTAKENKLLLDRLTFETDFLEELKKVIKKWPIKLHKKVKLKKKKKIPRSILAHISDTHIGVNIKKNEMGGINEFNPTIAARRFAKFFSTLCDYKLDHREDTELVMVLNGDIIAGIIHGQEGGVLPMTTQFSIALSIFAQGISFLAQHFQKIKVIGLVGNHGRYMHKSNKGRQTEQKWDSYTTNIYIALRAVFQDYDSVEFNIPVTPYALFEVQGHMYLAAHGDTFLNLGNPGKSINTDGITKQINNIMNGFEQKIDAVLGAHVHTPTVITLNNGIDLIINGTLSGTDPFAQSIGIVSNNPIQQLFEITKEHRIGDMRFVRLLDADEDKTLDLIIEPMEGLF